MNTFFKPLRILALNSLPLIAFSILSFIPVSGFSYDQDSTAVADSSQRQEVRYYANLEQEEKRSVKVGPTAEAIKGRISEREYYKGGQLKVERFKKEGKLDGAYLSYYKNGEPQCLCNYKDGKKDSVQMVHYANGQLWASAVFREGKPWEVISAFDPEGNPLEAGTLKNGYGTMYMYTASGALEMIVHYKKGKIVRRELKNKKALFN